MKTKITIAVLTAILFIACSKEENTTPMGQQQATPEYKTPGHHNHGNHYAFGNSTDSVAATLTNNIFPPLISDTMVFNHVDYFNASAIAYDSVTSVFTILTSGNFIITATYYRNTPNNEPSHLMLYVSNTLIYDTGWNSTGTISLQYPIHLNSGETVYIRSTDGAHVVFSGGLFTLTRN